MVKKATLGWVMVLVAVYLLALFLPIDPAEQRPGTRLSGTEAAATQWPDLVAQDYPFREKQAFVETRPWYGVRHSVTTTVSVRDGRLYIPCAYCSSKRWPKNVTANENVRVRVDGKIFAAAARRVTDPAALAGFTIGRHGEELPDVWIYELTPDG